MSQQQTKTSSSMSRTDARGNIQTEDPEVIEPCGNSYL